MRRMAFAFALVAACREPAPPTCTPDTGAPAVDALAVCTHLESMRCTHDDVLDVDSLTECQDAYASYAAKVPAAEFARLTQCYAAASTCGDVGRCSLACVTEVPDAGP